MYLLFPAMDVEKLCRFLTEHGAVSLWGIIGIAVPNGKALSLMPFPTITQLIGSDIKEFFFVAPTEDVAKELAFRLKTTTSEEFKYALLIPSLLEDYKRRVN